MRRSLELIDSGLLYLNPHPGDWAIHGYFPNIIEIAPGELLCAHRRGSAIYGDDGRTWLLRSTDNGRTWREEGMVWDGSADERSYSYSTTFLSKTSEGHILLSGNRWHRIRPDLPRYNAGTGACMLEESIFFRSSDGGVTWSAPRRIPHPPGKHLEISSCIVELEDGRWFVPFDTHKAYDDPTPLRPYVVGLHSSDGGWTWPEVGPVAGGSTQDKTFWHARFIKLRDGRLLGFPWTGDATGKTFLPLHRVEGDPTARDWGPPESTGILGQTNWPVELDNGRLALVHTMRECDQPGIYVVLSQDEGRSFDAETRVEIWDAYGKESIGAPRTDTYPASHDNIAYGAPHGIRLHDGDILASFWAGQSGIMACRWARLRVVET